MPHKVQLIIDSVVDKLTDDLAVKVYRNRARPVDVSPAINVRMGSDEETELGTLNYTFRRLIVYIDLYTLAELEEDLNMLLLNQRFNVEQSLLYSGRLSEESIQYFEAVSQQDPDYNSDAEESAGSMRLVFPIIYRE